MLGPLLGMGQGVGMGHGVGLVQGTGDRFCLTYTIFSCFFFVLFFLSEKHNTCILNRNPNLPKLLL